MSTPTSAKPGDIVKFVDGEDVYIGIVAGLVPHLPGGISVKWILAPTDRFTFRHAHPDVLFWAGSASNQFLPQRLKVIGHAEE